MTAKPLPEDEPGAQERFDRAIKTALATKPTPHVKKTERKSARHNDGKGDGSLSHSPSPRPKKR